MDLVFPGDGFSLFRRLVGVQFDFFAMGPLSRGDLIRRVEIFYQFEGNGVVSVALALGSSKVASAESLAAGQPLLSSSTRGAGASQAGIPAFSLFGANGDSGRLAFYPGLKVSTGSQWIVVETGAHSPGVPVVAMVSVEIWRVVRVREAPSGE